MPRTGICRNMKSSEIKTHAILQIQKCICTIFREQIFSSIFSGKRGGFYIVNSLLDQIMSCINPTICQIHVYRVKLYGSGCMVEMSVCKQNRNRLAGKCCHIGFEVTYTTAGVNKNRLVHSLHKICLNIPRKVNPCNMIRYFLRTEKIHNILVSFSNSPSLCLFTHCIIANTAPDENIRCGIHINQSRSLHPVPSHLQKVPES